MGKTIYIDLELEKRKIIKQMKDLEKDLAQSIKRTEKNAKIKVELDDKELKKSTRRVSTDLTNTIKKVSNKKARLILDSGNFKSELNKIELVARDTGKKLDREFYKKLQIDVSDLEIAKRQAKEFENESRKLFNSGVIPKKAYRQTIQDTKDLSSATTEAQRRLQNYKNTGEKNLSRLQKKFNGVKDSIKGMVKAGLGFIGVAFVIQKVSQALNSASDSFRSYETAFAGFRKTLEATEEQFIAIEEGIVQMSKRIPKSVEELSRIAEVAGQMGIAADDILEFTETTAMLSTAIDGIEADEAVKIMSRLQDQTSETTGQLLNQANALVFLGNNYKANEGEILNFANEIKSLGSVVRFSSADLLAFSTIFVDAGINAEAGGTQVTKAGIAIETAVKTNAKSLGLFAEVSQKTVEQFKNDWNEDSASAFSDVLLGMGEAGDLTIPIMQELFGENARTAKAFLTVANNAGKLKIALEETRKEFENGTASVDEFNKKLETSDSKAILNENRWKAWSSSFGESISNAKLKFSDFFLLVIPNAFASVSFGLKFLDKKIQNGLSNITILIIYFGQTIASVFTGIADVFIGLGNNAKILGYNLGVAFNNVPGSIALVLNKGLQKISGFINAGLGLINKFAKAVGSDFKIPELKIPSLDTGGVEDSFKSFESISFKYTKTVGKSLYTVRDKFREAKQVNEKFLQNEALRLDKQRQLASKNSKKAIAERDKQIKDEINQEITAQKEKLQKLQDILDSSGGKKGGSSNTKNKILQKELELIELKQKKLSLIEETTKDTLENEISKVTDLMTLQEKYNIGTEQYNSIQKKILGTQNNIKNLTQKQQKELLKTKLDNIEKESDAQEGLENDLLISYKAKGKAIQTIMDLQEDTNLTEEQQIKLSEKVLDYKKEMGDISLKIFDKEKDSLEDLSKSIKKLQDEAKDIVGDKDTAVAERKLDILKRQKEIQKELKALEKDGVNKDFVKNTSREDLEKSVENEVEFIFGGKGVEAKQLLEYKKLLEEVMKLENEQKLVDNNLNADVFQEVTRQQGLSETEKILEKYNEEKVAIEDKLTVALQSLSDEGKAYKDLTDIKSEAEKVFTGTIVIETDKRIDEQARLLDDARRVAAEMVALGFNGQGFKASFTKKSADGSTQTVTRTVNITNNNTVKQNVDVRKLSREQAKQIARVEKSGNKF